jgi:hypothetical protein
LQPPAKKTPAQPACAACCYTALQTPCPTPSASIFAALRSNTPCMRLLPTQLLLAEPGPLPLSTPLVQSQEVSSPCSTVLPAPLRTRTPLLQVLPTVANGNCTELMYSLFIVYNLSCLTSPSHLTPPALQPSAIASRWGSHQEPAHVACLHACTPAHSAAVLQNPATATHSLYLNTRMPAAVRTTPQPCRPQQPQCNAQQHTLKVLLQEPSSRCLFACTPHPHRRRA